MVCVRLASGGASIAGAVPISRQISISAYRDRRQRKRQFRALWITRINAGANMNDMSYSRLMGMGVDARETIGLGCERCSLRYKHGRETEIPDRLRGVLPRT